MKKISLLLLCVLIFAGCKKNSTPHFHLGTVSYYPNFLWKEARTTKLVKTFIFDFNDDAIGEGCFAELRFTDKEGKNLSSQEIIIEVDGKCLKDNILKIHSETDSSKLHFSFPPEAKSGKYQGYITLGEHNLDRFNNIEKPQSGMNVLKWSISYDKQWNPLAKLLTVISVILFLTLFTWFLLLRPILYPHFQKCRKTMLILQNGQIRSQQTIILTGARTIVLANRRKSQGFFARIFKGRVKYVVSPYFEEPLKLIPAKRGNIRPIGIGYISTPGLIPRNGVAHITNNKRQIEIKLQ